MQTPVPEEQRGGPGVAQFERRQAANERLWAARREVDNAKRAFESAYWRGYRTGRDTSAQMLDAQERWCRAREAEERYADECAAIGGLNPRGAPPPPMPSIEDPEHRREMVNLLFGGGDA